MRTRPAARDDSGFVPLARARQGEGGLPAVTLAAILIAD